MTAEPATASRRWWRRMLGSTWFHLVAAFVVFGLLLTFVAKPYWVPSSSMEQTLLPGDRIVVNRLAFVGAQPATGDVIVFDGDDTWGGQSAVDENPIKAALRWLGEVSGFGPSGAHTLVKRVIGGPGQTVECCTDAGAILVDGEPLDEPYVSNDFPFEAGTLDCSSVPRSARCFDAVTVPDDSYLVLGDNRSSSADSAVQCRVEGAPESCWRWAPASGIVGKAAIVVWPLDRWRPL